MKNTHRMLLILSLFITTVLMVTGCNGEQEISQTKETNPTLKEENLLSSDSYILKVGEEEVYYNEVMVYVLLLKQEYEPNLGTQIWDYNTGEGSDFEEMAKQEVLDQITEIKIIGDKAKELGIELDNDEKAETLSLATEHFKVITAKDRKKYGITLGTLDKIYKENQLATKVYDITTADVDTEVSDKEAKQISIWQILVKTTSKDKEGNEIPITEEEKAAALKKTRDILKKARNVEDFKTFSEEYTQDSQVEYTFGKGDMDKTVEERAFALKTGEMSSIITSDLGFHILYCVSDFNEDATADKKEEIIMERQSKSFENTYKVWLEDYSVTVKKKLWDQVTFKE